MKNILALLADFANGIFAVLIGAHLYGVDILWWHVLFGVLCAMLPDIDAIPEFIVRRRVSASAIHLRDHRTFLHYPIISLPLMFACWLAFGYLGAVLCVAVLLHLVNDLYGTGWGIACAWPFSKKRFKLCFRRVNRIKQHLHETGDWALLSIDDRRLRLLVSWDAAELPQYIRRFGYEDWIGRMYLRLNWISGIEYSLFVIAVCLLILHF